MAASTFLDIYIQFQLILDGFRLSDSVETMEKQLTATPSSPQPPTASFTSVASTPGPISQGLALKWKILSLCFMSQQAVLCVLHRVHHCATQPSVPTSRESFLQEGQMTHQARCLQMHWLHCFLCVVMMNNEAWWRQHHALGCFSVSVSQWDWQICQG